MHILRTIAAILLVPLLSVSCKKQDERYLVISKVRSASKLATTETLIDKIVLGTQEKRLLGIIRINESRFVAYTKAIVKAGIDLTELTPGDVRIEDKRIELMLPHVRVLDFDYPFSEYKIDSNITENAFLNKMTVVDYEYFYQQAEIDIRNNLKYSGIKTATEEKTRLLFSGLLKNLGYEEIYIQFKTGPFIEEINLNAPTTEE
ncbi:MAG: DUF4230 domain-containing protein [Cytophagales bacterium]|nr:DUF4230 domain-containing protein [Cytophaga sp.]